jgi:hypothetical protein
MGESIMPFNTIATVAATAATTGVSAPNDRYRLVGACAADQQMAGVSAPATAPSANDAFTVMGVGRTCGEKVLEQTMKAIGGKAGTDALGTALGRSPVAGVLTLGGALTASCDTPKDVVTNGAAVTTMAIGYAETIAKRSARVAGVLATTAGKGAARMAPGVGNALLAHDILNLVGPPVERSLRGMAAEGSEPAQACIDLIDATRAEVADIGRRAQGLGSYEATDIEYGA